VRTDVFCYVAALIISTRAAPGFSASVVAIHRWSHTAGLSEFNPSVPTGFEQYADASQSPVTPVFQSCASICNTFSSSRLAQAMASNPPTLQTYLPIQRQQCSPRHCASRDVRRVSTTLASILDSPTVHLSDVQVPTDHHPSASSLTVQLAAMLLRRPLAARPT